MHMGGGGELVPFLQLQVYDLKAMFSIWLVALKTKAQH